MLTGEICVLRKYNAIHNISIPRVDIDPRAGGCLAAMSARFCDGCHDVGQRAGRASLGAGWTIRPAPISDGFRARNSLKGRGVVLAR